MTDPELKNVHDNLKEALEQKSGMHQDDRIVQLSQILFPGVSDIDKAIGWLQKLKAESLNVGVDVFMTEYLKPGKVVLDLDRLLRDAQGQMSYRKGLKKMAIAMDVAGVEVPAAPQEEPNRCEVQG